MGIGAARGTTLLRIILVDKQAATAVDKTLPCAVLKTMSFDLAETIITERLVSEEVTVGVLVIGASDAVVPIAKMVCNCTAFSGNLLEVMSRYVARSFVVVGVIDVIATGMSDSQDLACPLRPGVSVWRRSASIARRVIIGVSDGIDIPVRIVA
jgi:hypothetical protein